MENSKQLSAYIVSDVHLNNQAYNRDTTPENPHRQHFRQFLSNLAEMTQSRAHPILLILNGDIFDITGSWTSTVLPWDKDNAAVEEALLQVFREILDNNRHIVSVLSALLRMEQVQLIYILGNHDRLLGLFPAAQATLIAALSGEQTHPRIRFCTTFESPDLGLYVEHGQRFDPFNCEQYQQNPPIGDMVNILIVNRFIERVESKMRADRYSEAIIGEIQAELQNVEYLRPLPLGPYWLESLAYRYHDHPENTGKAQPIDRIIHAVISDTLLDEQLVNGIADRFYLPVWTLKWAFRLLAHHPKILPVLSFLVSIGLQRTTDNRFQSKMAKFIQKQTGYHLITFGHTHIPGLIPLSERDYYFNTGCWKPLIYLFKYPQKPFLEYLFTPVPFNRIERSAFFRIEKDLNQPEAPAHFSLETIQKGCA